jgi:hypothetical protein
MRPTDPRREARFASRIGSRSRRREFGRRGSRKIRRSERRPLAPTPPSEHGGVLGGLEPSSSGSGPVGLQLTPSPDAAQNALVPVTMRKRAHRCRLVVSVGWRHDGGAPHTHAFGSAAHCPPHPLPARLSPTGGWMQRGERDGCNGVRSRARGEHVHRLIRHSSGCQSGSGIARTFQLSRSGSGGAAAVSSASSV